MFLPNTVRIKIIHLAEINAVDHIPAQRVRVGDIDIAYKQLGNNSSKPIVLINGLATTMDMWSPLY